MGAAPAGLPLRYVLLPNSSFMGPPARLHPSPTSPSSPSATPSSAPQASLTNPAPRASTWGGGGLCRGARGRVRGAGRGGGRGGRGSPARNPARPAALRPSRSEPRHPTAGPRRPSPSPLPVLGLLHACGLLTCDPTSLLASSSPRCRPPPGASSRRCCAPSSPPCFKPREKPSSSREALFLSFSPLLLSAGPAADRSSCSVSSSIKANVRDLQENHLVALVDRAADRALFSHLAGVGLRQEALEGLSSTARVNIIWPSAPPRAPTIM